MGLVVSDSSDELMANIREIIELCLEKKGEKG
jgi:predicted RNase H-like HicB family nuclease